MTTDENLNHEFLELRPVLAPKKLFLSGMSIGARVRLLVLTGLFALIITTGLILFSENRLSMAFDKEKEADYITVLAGQLKLSIANARSAEQAFLISKDWTFAEEFHSHLVSVSEVLNQLAQISVVASQQKNLDTIRDGLAQYDEQFSKILDLKKTLGLKGSKLLSQDLQAVAKEARQFDDLLSYLAPSTGAIIEFAGDLRSARAQNLTFARVVSRVIIICGGAFLIVLLTLVGFMVIRSIATPLDELAATVGRLAEENNLDILPAWGSSDSTGAIAKALDHWQEALLDLSRVRLELAQVQNLIKKSSSQKEVADMTAANFGRQEYLPKETVDQVPSELYLEPTPPDFTADPSNGSLSSASRQLTNFSEYVNAAANDVERTGSLIKGLDDTTQKMKKMDALFISIRDQTNLLAFCSGSQTSNFDNIVFSSDEEKKIGDGESFANRDIALCVDVIRDATEQADGISISMRQAMAEVTLMAREIAITSSEQAIEATTKLLFQSEHLQSMLSAVISKVEPTTSVGDAVEDREAEELKGIKPKLPTIKT